MKNVFVSTIITLVLTMFCGTGAFAFQPMGGTPGQQSKQPSQTPGEFKPMGGPSGQGTRQTTQFPMGYVEGGYFRTSALMDKKAVNPQGQDLGTVKDLIFGQGRVQYLIVSPKGKQELVPIPWDIANVKIRNGEVVAEISKNKLDSAPSFQTNQWPDFAQGGYEQKIHSYYSEAR